jgi:hypothetical protein
MPIYEFISKSGETVDRFYRMAEVPDCIHVGGVRFRRKLAPSNMFVNVPNHEPYLVHSQHPSQMKGCKMVRSKSGRMKALIEGKQHEIEVMAENDLVHDDGDYDGPVRTQH